MDLLSKHLIYDVLKFFGGTGTAEDRNLSYAEIAELSGGDGSLAS